LTRHARFFRQLGEKPREIKSEKWTLNQRVQGSSPCAPTIKINTLAALFGLSVPKKQIGEAQEGETRSGGESGRAQKPTAGRQ
jgi:hypothetical protein